MQRVAVWMRETTRNMTALRLPDAARQVGLHRSSLFRAIRSGRLSATRTEGGDFLIDPSELFRVYPPKEERPQLDASTGRVAGPSREIGARTTASGGHHATFQVVVALATLNGGNAHDRCCTT